MFKVLRECELTREAADVEEYEIKGGRAELHQAIRVICIDPASMQ